MKFIDRKAGIEWDDFYRSIVESVSVDLTESVVQQKKRITQLESDPEEWFKYYFPKFSFAAPADFHKKATKRILINSRWYEVRAWSRELAKRHPQHV